MAEIIYENTQFENIKINGKYYKIHDLDAADSIQNIKDDYIKIPDNISKGDIIYYGDNSFEKLDFESGKVL